MRVPFSPSFLPQVFVAFVKESAGSDPKKWQHREVIGDAKEAVRLYSDAGKD